MKKVAIDDVPATEDLMREHGLLNRILLIYDEIIQRIEHDKHYPLNALTGALEIIKTFIEGYHEKLEEVYLFPLFEQHKVKVQLVKTLRTQHNKGRELTAKLLAVATPEQYNTPTNKKKIKALLQKFIAMYRPHEAREDTELFPLVRSLITEKEFEQLSDKFEEFEHVLFGEKGFEMMLAKVVTIEKELGIYALEQFTPKI